MYPVQTYWLCPSRQSGLPCPIASLLYRVYQIRQLRVVVCRALPVCVCVVCMCVNMNVKCECVCVGVCGVLI